MILSAAREVTDAGAHLRLPHSPDRGEDRAVGGGSSKTGMNEARIGIELIVSVTALFLTVLAALFFVGPVVGSS
jgi:hypothetical protein